MEYKKEQRETVVAERNEKESFFMAEISTCQGLHAVHTNSLSRPTKTHKWNQAIVNVINYTCAFPACYDKSKCLLLQKQHNNL